MIGSFSGPYRFLSNFYPAPLWYGDLRWPTAEHAYQAAKAGNIRAWQMAVLEQPSPGRAKRFGRTIPLREDWEDVKRKIMFDVVWAKFSGSPGLAGMLRDTGGEYLMEGNTWGDDYWGAVDGVGRNYLGRILMAVRMLISDDGG